MTVSGVTHRSYFQRDLLISTVVTFAGGKIKLFARRKRTVKFDPNSEI